MADRRISIRLAVEDADRVKAILQGLGDEGAAMAAKIEAGTSRTGQSFEKLQRALDGAYNGQQRLAQAQEVLNRAVAQGITTQDRANQLLEMAQQRYLGAGQAAERMAQSAQRGFGGVGQFATQAGFQIQDFTVQVGAGQNALIAFAQQGSQLAGMFGAGGAIAGAALAIGAVTANLVLGKSAADALNAAIDAQDKLYQEALKAAEDYSGGLAAQAREVQSLTDRYAALNKEARDYELRRVQSARDDLVKQQGALGTTANSAVTGLLAQAQQQVNFAREAALRAGQPASSAAIPLDTQEATRAIAEFRAQVAEAGGVTAPILQTLATRLDEVAQRAGALEAPADRARRALDAIIPDAQKLDQQLGANQRQFDALTGSAQSGAAALAAAGAAARAAIDPFAELQRAIGNANAGLEALRTGGLAALNRLTAQQQDEEATTRRATAAREAYARALQQTDGISREAAEAQAKARDAEFQAQAQQAVSAERALADARKVAEEKERLARQAAARSQREAELAAERERKFRESLEPGGADQTVFPAQTVAAALQKQTDASAEVARKAAEQSARAIEQEEQRRQASFDRTIERYSADLGKATTDALIDGGNNALPNLATALGRAFRTAMAGALDVELFRPLLSGLFGGGGAGGTGGGGVLSGLTGMLGLSGLGKQASDLLGGGNLLSGIGGGISNVLGTPLFGSGALSSATNSALGGLGSIDGAAIYGPAVPSSLGVGGLTVGGALGAAGLGFGAGSLVGGLVSRSRGTVGPGSTIGAGVGALTGAAIGSIIPGVGTVIGGLIGGALGGGGGGLIGPTQKGLESRSGVAGIYTLDGDGFLKIQNVGGKRADTAGFTAQLQGQLDDINTALRSRGLTIQGGGAWSVGAGAAAAGLPANVDPNRFASMLYSNNPLYSSALGALRGQGADFNTALSSIDWIKQVYEPLTKAADGADQFSTAIDAINAKWNEVIGRAQSLSLATDQLVASRDKEIAAVEAQRDAQKKADEQKKTAEQKALADAASALFRDLTFGGNSALAPEGKYFAAVTALRGAAGGLAGGGQDAVDRYIAIARQALPVARDFLGTSERYGDLQAEVSRTLRGVAPGADGGLASFLEANADGTSRLIEITASYGAQQSDLLGKVVAEVSALRAQLVGLMARTA